MVRSSFWRIMSEPFVTLKSIWSYRELFFWIVLFPVLWYGLMIIVWGSPVTPTIELGIFSSDAVGNSTLSATLLKAFNSTKTFKLKLYYSFAELVNALEKGDIDVGIVIPANFTEAVFSGNPTKLIVLHSTSDESRFAVGVVMGLLSEFSNAVRSRAINISITYITQYLNVSGLEDEWVNYAIKWLRFIEQPLHIEFEVVEPSLLATTGGIRAYYALSMIGIEALFVGLFTGALSINERKRSGALAIILASPMKSWELMLTDTFGALAAVGVSAVSVIVVSLLTGAEYVVSLSRILAAATLLVAATLFAIGLGLLIAPLAKTPEGASALVNAIAFPAMFIGGLAIPPYILPEPLQVFAYNWPLGRILASVRKLLVTEADVADVMAYTWPALLVTGIIYVVGFVVYRRLLTRSLEYR